MSYVGDITLGQTVDIKFTTVDGSGVPTSLLGTPAVAAYVDNGTTEITAGITLTVDFDAVTGLNQVRVVASSGNGFATATNVDLVITAGTVDGNSVVGYVVGSFSIENRVLNAAKLAADAVDAIWDEVVAEPSAGAPPATPSFRTLLSWFWVAWRNLREQTASEGRIYNDAGTVLAERDVTDDGSTVSASEIRAAN